MPLQFLALNRLCFFLSSYWTCQTLEGFLHLRALFQIYYYFYSLRFFISLVPDFIFVRFLVSHFLCTLVPSKCLYFVSSSILSPSLSSSFAPSFLLSFSPFYFFFSFFLSFIFSDYQCGQVPDVHMERGARFWGEGRLYLSLNCFIIYLILTRDICP